MEELLAGDSVPSVLDPLGTKGKSRLAAIEQGQSAPKCEGTMNGPKPTTSQWEERNAAIVAQAKQQGDEYDQWRKGQLEALVSVVEMFQRMEKSINFIQHELLVNGRPKPRRKGRKG